MGRPKKLYSCAYCKKMFKGSVCYKKHCLSHSKSSMNTGCGLDSRSDVTSERRNARIRSNWCHACRQSFTLSEYKLHIMTEHQYDTLAKYIGASETESDKDIDIKISNNNENVLPNKIEEIDKNSSAKSPLKRGLQKLQSDVACPTTEIKPEPLDEYLGAVKPLSPRESKKINPRSSFVYCNKCGIKCKNERGLKVHLGTTHKRNSPSIKLESSPEEVKDEKEESLDVLPEETFQKEKVATSSINHPFSPNTSSSLQLSFNTVPIQTPVIDTGTENKTNVQLIPIVVNQNPPVETIPKFNPESESYIKWLRKFINKCKMHKYPLPPELCKNLSHVNEEITQALIDPSGSLSKKSNHFFFMKIKTLISEIMMGQMRYTLNVVKR